MSSEVRKIRSLTVFHGHRTNQRHAAQTQHCDSTPFQGKKNQKEVVKWEPVKETLSANRLAIIVCVPALSPAMLTTPDLSFSELRLTNSRQSWLRSMAMVRPFTIHSGPIRRPQLTFFCAVHCLRLHRGVHGRCVPLPLSQVCVSCVPCVSAKWPFCSPSLVHCIHHPSS